MTARLRRMVAGALGVGLVVAGVGLATLNDTTARAAGATSVLSGFDPANIIDDAVMFNGSTMTVAEIQGFLNRQQPSCGSGATCLKSVSVNIPAMSANPMCRAMPARSGQSAAQVIVAVGVACNVNPQVILVMLQKEQTLVTGRTPYSGETVSTIYRKATGLGCPDTAACDPAKYGLFNQLYGVAYWLVRYTMPPGTGSGTPYSSQYTWFPVGKANGVLYNPSAACGAGTITIRNKATASLYYYTPYQPNGAALAAGWGIGNSCSAYGNRNFYLYFTTWFGSTHYVVTGAIKTFWAAHKSALGNPTGNSVATSANGGGTMQTFSGGTVYSSRSGTFVLTGALRSKYSQVGGPSSVLGWPRMNVFTRTYNGGGSIQGFQGGALYSSRAGTYPVSGAIHTAYDGVRAAGGGFAWPTSDPTTTSANGGGTSQRFTGGSIFAATGQPARRVSGAALQEYQRRRGPSSTLGWPTKDVAASSRHGAGTYQLFQHGGIYTSSHGTSGVLLDLYGSYSAHGAAGGVLGWPLGGATSPSGGAVQRFMGGTIYWSAAGGAHSIGGTLLRAYLAAGGPAGGLGWPTKDNQRVTSHGGGNVQWFSGGAIYSSHRGAYLVQDAILTKYDQLKGPSGALGWPVGPPTSSNGRVTQQFAGGSITWSRSVGAIVR